MRPLALLLALALAGCSARVTPVTCVADDVCGALVTVTWRLQ